MTMAKIYRYGALEPTDGKEALREQVRRAIRYRRRLIDIERTRWDQLAECEKEHCAEIAAAKAVVEELDHELETRPRAVNTEERQETRKLRERRREAADRLRELRAKVRQAHASADAELAKRIAEWLRERERTDPPGKGLARRAALDDMLEDERWPAYWRARMRIERDYSQTVRDARASSGLYHGTYSAVEDAVERATKDARKIGQPPSHSWVESVRIGTQCQDGELSNRLEIDPLLPAPPNEGRYRRRLRSRTVARVRIGSQDDGSPVWCELPIVLHRPIPAGSKVLWAYVIQRRIGARTRYELQLTVQADLTRAPAIRHAAVAVSIGWQNRDESSVLAAKWVGTEGCRGEVVVPPVVSQLLSEAHRVHGIADRLFEAARTVFCDIRHSLTEDEQQIVKTAALWRSHAKLTRAIRRAIGDSWLDLWKRWRRARLAVGLDLMPTMEESREWHPEAPEHWYLYCWTKKDQHLTQWERDVERRALLHRREIFRVTAARLAARYETVVLTGAGETKSGLADLRQFARQDRLMLDQNKGIRAAEHEDRSQRVRVAPGELRQSLVEAFGGSVVAVPGEMDRTCTEERAEALLAGWREQSGGAQGTGGARTAESTLPAAPP